MDRNNGFQIERAKAGDCRELLDFLLSVFRRNTPNHMPFNGLYPEMFVDDDESMGRHAVIRDGGRIVSCVGAYPMTLQMGAITLPTLGIGQVSTSENHLGRGYMSALLRHQLECGRENGAVIAWLGGRRDRYSHFGFDVGFTSLDYQIDRRSFGGRTATHRVEKLPSPESITPAMFELRSQTAHTVLEPLSRYRERLRRCRGGLEVLTATRDGASDPDSWAVHDSNQGFIVEWCGSLEGRVAIIDALLESGRGLVLRRESPMDFEANDFLREHSLTYCASSTMLAILDADALIARMAPVLPAGYSPKAEGGTELVRELFGFGRGSLSLPFYMPTIFNV